MQKLFRSRRRRDHHIPEVWSNEPFRLCLLTAVPGSGAWLFVTEITAPWDSHQSQSQGFEVLESDGLRYTGCVRPQGK